MNDGSSFALCDICILADAENMKREKFDLIFYINEAR